MTPEDFPAGRFQVVPNAWGGRTTVRTPAVRPATDRQVSYLRDLVARKTPHVSTDYTERVIAAGFDRVRKAIDTLKGYPDLVRAETEQVAATHEVAAGHYAVPTAEGHLAFYRVDCPTEGRWAGRTFVSLQLSDNYDRLPKPVQTAVLAKIATDPKAAMLAYGQNIGRCGHCNRTLTNEQSRAYGLGPVCREAMGW